MRVTTSCISCLPFLNVAMHGRNRLLLNLPSLSPCSSQRGYGGSSAPEHFAEYTCTTLASDMLALLAHIGADTCCLVGHDHGANTGWTIALLHPSVFTCYMAISVPYLPRQPDSQPPLETYRQGFVRWRCA